jgi:hypothetical protein
VPEPSYVCGLDLGQLSDYTALALVERAPVPGGRQRLALRGLVRYPLGTPYAAPGSPGGGVVERVRARLSGPPAAGCILAVDQTGVGRPVVDLIRAAGLPVGALVPVTITAGQQARQEADPRGLPQWLVPKKDLVGLLLALFGTGRLVIAPGLALADALRQEVFAFRSKVTLAGNESFAAWRERDHDDLVLAVALACWAAENFPAVVPGAVGTGRGRLPGLPHGVFASDLRPGRRGA